MLSELTVNILLVDDHPENLLALEAILDPLGGNLVKAHSGEEALRSLLHQDFAVILLDVQMPGMDGFETATLIRSRERSRHTPIIFLTAFNTNDSLVFRGYSLGAVDYLLKPIEADILTSKVGVFIELFKKTEEVKRQSRQLASINTELRESEERFRLLSACSPVGIFLTDVNGSCTYTNPRFQAICDLTLPDALGDGWLQAVHPEDRQQVIADWFAYTREIREYSNEFRFQTRSGEVRWTHVRSSPMFSNTGELMGHVGTVEDITGRKNAEAARVQIIHEQAARQQAEAANRMKDEFLAVLSHELRTPLNSMMGWARLLRTKKFDEETTARALETIERNARSQAQLIEDILDVSLIVRGKLRLNLCPINFASVVEQAVESVRPLIEVKALQLEMSVANSAIPVCGDPTRLQQIVWNLLTNAIKFTPEQGRIVVELTQQQEQAQLRVTDSGIGIQPEFLPHVFDRFRQADGTTTRPHSGLGLGLAIVRHLIELHSGTVQAASEGEGRGASFTVQIPLLRQSEGQEDHAKPLNSAHALASDPLEENLHPSSFILHASSLPDAFDGIKVLVVDDEADTREVLAVTLAESGIEVTTAASAQEALKLLKSWQPKLLVSDIGMPGEDGYSLIRQVRRLSPAEGGSIPAVALTAYSREEDRKQVLSAGFQMHVSKPVEATELLQAIATLSEQAIAPSSV
ncbi:response regulator [Leptolyngbya sp. FACHB-541]|uniref:hybrid sensor histidine kinase/response regulator n=1 Tax=Leptolyngbya sp. FACHB-541 TaxID=2692810 RepID=UPI001682D53C|nr:response regulator [Leptolyngbya sp. FACHB-541]MBD2000505.1 response regulator [Leptolyngbya sp. FACHB-541]